MKLGGTELQPVSEYAPPLFYEYVRFKIAIAKVTSFFLAKLNAQELFKKNSTVPMYTLAGYDVTTISQAKAIPLNQTTPRQGLIIFYWFYPNLIRDQG
jgi:hypothetical protein